MPPEEGGLGGKCTWGRAGFLGGVTPLKSISSLSGDGLLGDSDKDQKTSTAFLHQRLYRYSRPWVEGCMGSNPTRGMLLTFIKTGMPQAHPVHHRVLSGHNGWGSG